MIAHAGEIGGAEAADAVQYHVVAALQDGDMVLCREPAGADHGDPNFCIAHRVTRRRRLPTMPAGRK